MTQAPGEYRRIPTQHMAERVAVINCARRLLNECNNDLDRAVAILRAVADA
jgi:hypothetical protein